MIDEADGEIAVIVQAAHHYAADVIDPCRHAEEKGADLVAIISPYFHASPEVLDAPARIAQNCTAYADIVDLGTVNKYPDIRSP